MRIKFIGKTLQVSLLHHEPRGCSHRCHPSRIVPTRVIGTDCLLVDSLTPIERTVHTILSKWPLDQTDICKLEERDRETFAIAKHLEGRLRSFRRNGDCGRCWLQKAHCVCEQCPPLEEHQVPAKDDGNESAGPLLKGYIDRVFVLTHHKEICMVVDTAKLIAASLPASSRIVVGGVGPQFQQSMKEMLDCIQYQPSSCMVLFPAEESVTYGEIAESLDRGILGVPKGGWNLIVVDGTWEQARKLYLRYIHHNKPSNNALVHVKLSDTSLASILPDRNAGVDSPPTYGMQLRRHPEEWRQISTFAAVRLLLFEMMPDHVSAWNKMSEYQQIADSAALKQLGSIRIREANK